MIFRANPTLAKGVALALACTAAGAAEPAPGADTNALERIVVTATRIDAANTGGSVTFLDQDMLAQHDYADVNRVLRQVPGVNIVEEEGFGIRPSIGIRGSGTDRNSKIAVMEDGVPIAPAPYSAPSAYYFPRMPRMAAVEVSKGPAAIKYGPQTVAGALGMYSTPIPDDPAGGVGGRLDLLGGDFGTYRVHGLAGGYFGPGEQERIGVSLETLQERSTGFKDLDSGGDTGYRIQDYVGKVALRSPEGAERPQWLEFKLQYSDENSDETYVGLALDDFRADPYRRYRGSQVDEMNVEHWTAQATHRIDFSDRLDLTTIAYYTDTARAWYKLNDVRNAADTGYASLTDVLADPSAFPTEYAAIVGAPGTSSAPGALRVRNNAREYYAAGVQSVLGYSFAAAGASHQLEASVRYHRDEEDRFQHDDRYQMIDGRMLRTSTGAPGSQDNRVGEAQAWALYVRDTIAFDRLTLAPGVRYESIELKRTTYGTADPGRDGPATIARDTVDVLLPGLGITYGLNADLKLVAGVHRGFVNPSPGSDADAEESWNYEAGLRFARGDVALEAIAFLVDYDNLVGTCTASTGGNCIIGDQFDGGEARVHGLELVAAWDAGDALGSPWSLPLSAVYTWTDAEFRTAFESDFEEWGDVEAGDDMPLVPEHQLTLNAGLEAERWRTYLTMNHVDETRSTAGSGAIPRDERIDRRTLLDLSAEYDLSDTASLFGSVSNLTDETYNVAFRPAGARPGAPRSWLAGVKIRF
ncbi:MAG TPA: TonB-dependent receptor [Steroidobacteraceae bacterium]|nr:TonB-dependent receptor [Steroidobacteraceae bacterium]